MLSLLVQNLVPITLCDLMFSVFVLNEGNDMSGSPGAIYRDFTEMAWLFFDIIRCEGKLYTGTNQYFPCCFSFFSISLSLI